MTLANAAGIHVVSIGEHGEQALISVEVLCLTLLSPREVMMTTVRRYQRTFAWPS